MELTCVYLEQAGSCVYPTMAKVVSSKFGDRQLVQLPPVSFSGIKSKTVSTIAPKENTQRMDGRIISSVIPNETTYDSTGPNNGYANICLSEPQNTFTGNIVKNEFRGKHHMQDVGFKMVQPAAGLNGPVLQYTPHALKLQQQHTYQQYSPSTERAPVAYQPEQSGQPLSYQGQPKSQLLQTDSNSLLPETSAFVHGTAANEKHIYYGPNGEVLPGPPPGFPLPGSGSQSEMYQRDFVADAVLEFGRVKTITNLDSNVQFPKLPEYLLKRLLQKYGEFERTSARIACRKGQFNVHGVPQIPSSTLLPKMPRAAVVPDVSLVPMSVYPEYTSTMMPLYADPLYPSTGVWPDFQHVYSTPPVMERSFPFEHDHSRHDITRISTEDPIAALRWQRTPTVD